jgi:hypothetical protein
MIRGCVPLSHHGRACLGVHDLRVDGGRPEVCVVQQRPEHADVRALVQPIRRERVAEPMRRQSGTFARSPQRWVICAMSPARAVIRRTLEAGTVTFSRHALDELRKDDLTTVDAVKPCAAGLSLRASPNGAPGGIGCARRDWSWSLDSARRRSLWW